jgi:hypothetical protein
MIEDILPTGHVYKKNTIVTNTNDKTKFGCERMFIWQGENNISIDIKRSNPIPYGDSNNQLHSNRNGMFADREL